MASTYTPNLNLEKPGHGDKRGTWDTVVNANMDILDAATRGATGIQGTTGIQGQTGIQGLTGLYIQGVTGIQGTTGTQGTHGDTGIQGITGLYIQGVTGIQGATGIGNVTSAGVTGAAGTAAGSVTMTIGGVNYLVMYQ